MVGSNGGNYTHSSRGNPPNSRATLRWGNFPCMQQTFREALEYALTTTKRSLLSVSKGSGVNYELLKSLRQGRSLTTSSDEAMKVAEAFGVTLDDFYAGRVGDAVSSIPVVGHVGAGAEVDLVDVFEKGDGLYRIACPPQLSPRGIVAVEVAGDSMVPVYVPGTILFYTRATLGVPAEAIGHICVCEDDENHAWVKQVRIGREEGTFTLVSMNPDYEHRHAVRLNWAAPVRFPLPPEFVRRID